MSRYFLGVDGGQSSTTAIVGDEAGRVLGYGRGGPCNHVSGAEAKARFVGAMGEAVRATGVVRFDSACLGFSGGAEDKASWLDEVFTAERRVVTHDGLIALVGATGGAPGVIIIAGTGQFAFGRNETGRTARAGGWGYVYGDEGGGFDLTRQALRAALRAEEGWGPPTVLRELLLAASGARDANELLHRLYTTEFARPIVAGWSRLVDEAAEGGDGCAIAILEGAGRALAEYTLAVYKGLFTGASPVAYIGGAFKSRKLLAAFRRAIAPVLAGPPLYGPAVGALLEAYRIAGLAPMLSNVPEIEK